MESQKEMNKQMDAGYEESKIQNITLETAIKDMTDATKGILDDILGSGQSSLGLWEIVSKDNRLRGLGMVFILTSSVVLIIRAVTTSK